jgi:hypothetical protein
MYAVVPEAPTVGTGVTVNMLPPAVYPVADTSPSVVYTAVDAFRVARFVYSAILNTSDVPVLKL